MKRELYEDIKAKTLEFFNKAKIILTKKEIEAIEIADFGLEDIYNIGLQLVTYINTSRCCAKELVLLPGQTCPEHRHPRIGGYPGKEETFRVRFGEIYLYVNGEETKNIKGRIPENGGQYYTVRKEIILKAGEQYTLSPSTRHWFQAGENGAVVSEFSTSSYDEVDIFTDIRIQRIPSIEE